MDEVLDPTIPRVRVKFDTNGMRNFYITDSATMLTRRAKLKDGVWSIYETYPRFDGIRSDGEHFKWTVNKKLEERFEAVRNYFKEINGWIPSCGTIPAFCVWLNRQDDNFDETTLPEQINVESIRMTMALLS